MDTMERSTLFLAAAATFAAAACETPTGPNARTLDGGARPGFDEASTSQTMFSGEATVVQADVAGVPIRLGQAGPLDPSGGADRATLFEINQTLNPVALSGRIGHASTVGQGKRSRSQATVADVRLDVNGTLIEASFLGAEATAVCDAAANAVGSASSEIANLRVAGQSIVVFGRPDETVDVPVPGLTIVLNKQDVRRRGNNDIDVTVTALHVTFVDPVLGTTTVVNVARAHADIRCGRCADKGDDFTTGGGWIATATSSRANFAIAGGKRSGWGHLTYHEHDKAEPMVVKSESIDNYYHAANRSVITGRATVNGVADQPFEVEVTDNGEPGRGADQFHIRLLSTGYTRGGTLAGGNIQFHDRPNSCPVN
jgi:hypothetical protein